MQEPVLRHPTALSPCAVKAPSETDTVVSTGVNCIAGRISNDVPQWSDSIVLDKRLKKFPGPVECVE